MVRIIICYVFVIISFAMGLDFKNNLFYCCFLSTSTAGHGIVPSDRLADRDSPGSTTAPRHPSSTIEAA